MRKYVIIFVTSPVKSVDKIINFLLEKKIVACINKIENVKSFYWWRNKICKDKEVLLIIKTKKKLLDRIIKEIKKIHPYEVPEIISFEIYKGNKEYLEWINNTTI
ncbi:MAG: divalent-cation tolerance protein CutA [Elusimicrobiota bacterium]|nr:divalent-cation tolerance protein CutA [Endomicrobiia bacterium]MDW8165808.1 divalent-cation tolerance protein CutA [Elusimicrobiota bacterium]